MIYLKCGTGGYSFTLKRVKSSLMFCDINTDGNYNGRDTKYVGEIKRTTILKGSQQTLDLVDPNFPDRFSTMAELKDGLTKRVKYLIRDMKTKEILLFPDIRLNEKQANRVYGAPEIKAYIITGIAGEITNTDLVDYDYFHIVNLTNNMGHYSVEITDGDTGYGKNVENIFFSLGDSSTTIGDGVNVDVKILIRTHIEELLEISKSKTNADNLLISLTV